MKRGKFGYWLMKSRAFKYLRRPDRALQLMNKAIWKLSKKENVLDQLKEEFFLLIQLVKDWGTGRYTHVSKKTISMSIVAIIYFLTPVDLIPDFIFGIGFIDDASVIGYVIQAIRSDIKQYKIWIDQNENHALEVYDREEL